MNFEKYLENKKKRYYLGSILFFIFALLTYEISYAFILLYLPILMISGKNQTLKKRLKTISPFLIVLFSLALYTLYLRSTLAVSSGPYLPNWDLWVIFSTYIKQTISTLPTSYFFFFSNADNLSGNMSTIGMLAIVLFMALYVFIVYDKKEK